VIFRMKHLTIKEKKKLREQAKDWALLIDWNS
jgi:hypothetical protein